jgi:hypothetical protein
VICKVVETYKCKIPPEYKLKVLIMEYLISPRGELLFCGQKWVLSIGNLWTRIIQGIHDLVISGYPRREAIYAFIIY